VEEVTEMLRNDHQLTVKKIEKNWAGIEEL
jgi:hypothetical protein